MPPPEMKAPRIAPSTLYSGTPGPIVLIAWAWASPVIAIALRRRVISAGDFTLRSSARNGARSRGLACDAPSFTSLASAATGPPALGFGSGVTRKTVAGRWANERLPVSPMASKRSPRKAEVGSTLSNPVAATPSGPGPIFGPVQASSRLSRGGR